MFCSNCGASIEPGNKYCTECGAPVNNTENTASYSFFDVLQTEETGQDSTYDQNNYNNNQQSYYNDYNTSGIMPRNIVMCIVLSLVTCGIYNIYWMIKLNDEINILDGSTDDLSGVVVFLLTLITCGIYGIYWFFKMGTKIDNIKSGLDITPSSVSSSVLYLILALVGLGIVDYCLMQETINKAVS
ncbi:MAG: DUF4234 domain-containing protein [Lachnospiraceae bacterium]|nr:DUF4234 domain-containing protein [Lachnospiraceae bacterium]